MKSRSALDADHSWFKQLFELSPDPTWIIRDNRFVECNDAAIRILGYTSREELLNAHPSKLSPATQPDGGDSYVKAVRMMAIAKDQGMHRFEWVHTKANGADFLAEVTLSVLELLGGSITYCTWRDITERKQAENALHQSEQGYRTMIDSAPEGVWMLDPGRRTSEVNQRMCDLLGYARKDMLGRGPIEFADAENGKIFQQQARRVPSRETRTYEVALRHRDGRNIPTEFSATNLFNEDGCLMGVIAFVVDLTERRRMEDQVRQMAFHDTLTNLPNRRLLNDRLSQAVAANKRSGRYGAVMFLDLDNFKSLNDAYGHAVGDLLLIETAARLKSCVREMDTVGRFGGDEFVVMISELDVDRSESAAEAGFIAEKVRAALAKPYMLQVRHNGKADATVEHLCTVSIGVALFGKHADSPDDILKWADNVMYQAKEAGRNLIRFYDSNA